MKTLDADPTSSEEFAASCTNWKYSHHFRNRKRKYKDQAVERIAHRREYEAKCLRKTALA